MGHYIVGRMYYEGNNLSTNQALGLEHLHKAANTSLESGGRRLAKTFLAKIRKKNWHESSQSEQPEPFPGNSASNADVDKNQPDDGSEEDANDNVKKEKTEKKDKPS